MAFTFASAAGGGGFGGQAQASAGTQVQDGPDLQEIQTDQLGFSAINGDAKVRLLPSPWPMEALPTPTSSLLSIASNKGLIAAAGPDTLIITRTISVRSAFRDNQDPKENIKAIQPEIEISVPRLSHVAFSADENILVIATEEKGGLLAYHVDKLTSGETIPALEISTNGSKVRALVPNPMPVMAALFAVVTANGELLLADFQSESLRGQGTNPVLKSGVSCVSWSNKGKQLVTGLENGCATQLRQDGTVAAEIPKSTSIPSGMHISAISWLEDNQFFVVYTPNDSTTDGMMPSSEYWIISREKSTKTFAFQKLPEVCPPFGLERLPTYHYINRLRDFKPHLQDLLLLASSTSIDIGLVSKSDQALSDENVTGDFTFTSIGDDTRRAQLPLSESMSDTSPIGMGLDLSSTEEIVNPIPSDPEIRQSSTPLPNLLVLNQEGILASWWVVHNASIREKTMFRGLVAAAGTSHAAMRSPTSSQATPSQAAPSATGGFGQPGFGNVTPFTKPATSGFGTPAPSSTFGNSQTGAFGAPSTLGGAKPSWTNTGFGTSSTPQAASNFGQPAFGSATPVGGAGATPAFGSASAIGNRASPFGTAAPTAFGKPGLGASGFGGGSTTSPFGTATTGSKTSGFASFAGASGPSGFAAAKADGQSPFGKVSSSTPFSQAGGPSSLPARSNGDSAFGGAKASASNGLFGTGAAFKIESSFKGDGSAKDDLPRPTGTGGFGFGNGFGDLLNEPEKALSPTHDKETEMGGEGDVESDHDVGVTEDRSDSAEEEPARGHDNANSLITPPTTMKQPNITPAPPLSGLFGPGNATQSTTPLAAPNTTPSFSFGKLPSTTPKDTPAQSQRSIFSTMTQPDTTPAAAQESKPTNWFSQISEQKISEKNSAGKWLQNAVDEKSGNPTTEKPSSEQQTPKVKAEPPSDEETVNLNDIPEAPLPPDTTSKASYTPGGTSVGSDRSKQPSDDDAPLPPDFIPPRLEQSETGPSDGPEDEGDFSSDFDGSGEDVTQDISPIDDPEHTENIQTSPESSFGRAGDKGSDESPTGGLFTKVTANPSQKASRTLFGEVGSTGPIFPPPKPQESPRSPSPVRHLQPHNLLRPDTARSVSAPGRPASVINQRRAQLGQSGLSNQTRDLSATRAKAHAEALAAAEAQAKAEAALELEDDEDERLRQELAQPVQPSQELEAFVSYQKSKSDDASKVGIPGQIERLYQDINSMIDTLGINARSLSSFMLYQQSQQPDQAWPEVLKSETPMDALNGEWILDDTSRLQEGIIALQAELESRKITDVAVKLQQCQEILSRDIVQLRTKLASIRKALGARSDVEWNMNAPLCAEQASIQHDLRKASTAVQMKLTQSEESLSMLRAKLAESGATSDKVGRGKIGRSASQKKPTVEAVTNTIAKMTSMAEKKSTDIDVLEAQLKRLNMMRGDSVEPDGTPSKLLGKLSIGNGDHTPGSQSGSVYHTPDSKFSRSLRSTPGSGLRESMNGALVSVEESGLLREKAIRRKHVADVLRGVLVKRRVGRSATTK